MALLTNGLDDGALVPPGEYVKADGGVRFSVTRDATFVFRGEAQAIEARYDVRGRPCFEIYWQWGRPTFSLDADGALVEDGRHVFRRAGEPPAQAATPEAAHARVLLGAVAPWSARRRLGCCAFHPLGPLLGLSGVATRRPWWARWRPLSVPTPPTALLCRPAPARQARKARGLAPWISAGWKTCPRERASLHLRGSLRRHQGARLIE